MSNKARFTGTMDPKVLSRLDDKVENRSQFFEKMAKKKLAMENTDNEELLQRKEELEGELEEIKEEEEHLRERRNDIENELNAIRSTLEKAEEEKDVLSDALPVLVDKYQELKRDRVKQDPLERIHTTETFNMWLEKMELDSEELKEKIKEEVEE